MRINLPPISPDPVIEAYKKEVDRTTIRENLALTPEQRLEKLAAGQRFFGELREAGRKAHRAGPRPSENLLVALAEAGTEFIVVGGAAAAIHGSRRESTHLDIVCSRSAENVERLASALERFSPRLRGVPERDARAFTLDALRHGLNLKLATDAGDLDLLAEVAGEPYEFLRNSSMNAEAFGVSFLRLGADRLIALGRASARFKDKAAAMELEAIWHGGAALLPA